MTNEVDIRLTKGHKSFAHCSTQTIVGNKFVVRANFFSAGLNVTEK